MDRNSSGPAHVSGFTLLELMIALAIVGILMAVAAPNFRNAMMNVRISAQTNDLMSDLSLARSEAVKRNLPVFLCASKVGAQCDGAAWNEGWMLFVDADNDGTFDKGEEVLKARAAAEGANTISATVGGVAVLMIAYRPTGAISGGAAGVLRICDTRTTPNSGRQIDITVTGRPRATPVTCS